jgi:hypothetical protein
MPLPAEYLVFTGSEIEEILTRRKTEHQINTGLYLFSEGEKK